MKAQGFTLVEVMVVIVIVTVLMSDIRSYSTIAEHADPSQLAGQLNTHRAAMNEAILGQDGTVMQFVGDAVMACFGAPVPLDDHADRAVCAARSMLERQRELNERWLAAIRGLPEVTAQESLHFLMTRVDAFVGVTRQSDDITCMIFRAKRPA